jgi:glycosyltransferase involved in cell wall biosynthesis
MAFFSVIIPLYNKENFIENTLKSVLNQSFTDFEVLIVNDGSTDTSEQKAKQFNDPRISYFLKENEGVASARNYGINLAKAEHLTFIDADDYWYPDFLQEMFNNINRYPELNVFSAAIEVETSKKVFTSSYSIVKTGDCQIVDYFSASRKESVICTSCAVFHKRVFNKSGVFDPNMKISEDTDLWIRIGLNYPVLFSWKILARYVYDDKSLTKNHKNSINSFDFYKYSLQEKTNPSLKKFLDLNRFSLAIKSKIIGDNKRFLEFYEAINLKKISLKKRILLKLPVLLLKPLIELKTLLANFGLGNSVFK